MGISGTESSSVIDPYPKNVVTKIEKWCPKVPKQAEPKWDGVIKPQNTISINFKHGKV